LFKTLTLEPAIVLHTRAFKETSLIVDAFTRNYGRISIIAKGAKRPKNKLGVIKTPSSLFLISCRGRSELKTLTHCELNKYFDLSPKSFSSLVYLNELLVKLLEKEDSHPEIFDHYLKVCDSLSEPGRGSLEVHLRTFELNLLKEIGYGLDLKFEANSNNEIKEEGLYGFDPIIGFQPVNDESNRKNHYTGKDIINFSKGDLSSPESLSASKQIMREAIDFHLGNKPLKIREYFSLQGS